MPRPDEPNAAFLTGSDLRARVVSYTSPVSNAGFRDSGSLTYEPYFGLQEKPFSLSPDPRFFFGHSSHGETFAALVAGIRRREGVLALTGEVGTGKTTLCRAVLQSLDRRTSAAFVTDPFLSREDLLKTLLVEFGVVSTEDIRTGRLRGVSRTDLCYPLYDFLTSLQPLQSFAVMMIDEAQNLSSQLLEEIRILSELENRQKLLQVVLIGQPELQVRLGTPEMRQLSQRLAVRCELLPLLKQDIGPYISHRLHIAGNRDAVQFTPAAVEHIWRISSGIPRVINLVCDRALLRAAGASRTTVNTAEILHAADDLRLSGAGSVDTSSNARASKTSAVNPNVYAELSPAARPMRSVLFGDERGSTVPSTLSEAASEEGYEADVTPAQRRGRTLLALVALLTAAIAAISYWSWPATISPSRVSRVTQPSQSLAPAPRDIPRTASVVPSTAREDPARDAPASGLFPKPDGHPMQTSAARFVIEMATFQNATRAAEAAQQFINAGYNAYSSEVPLHDGGNVSAVFIGPYAEVDLAERDLQRAQQVSGYRGGLIVHVGSVGLRSELKPELSASAPTSKGLTPPAPTTAALTPPAPTTTALTPPAPTTTALTPPAPTTAALTSPAPTTAALTPPAQSPIPREVSAVTPIASLSVRESTPAELATLLRSEPPMSLPATTPNVMAVKGVVKPSVPQTLTARFAIQMGTFRNVARATEALQELHDAGYHAYSAEVSQRDGGSALAVFLGPYTELAPAEKDLERAQQIPGYGDGHIVQFGASAVASKP